jgi:hypothetical protein
VADCTGERRHSKSDKGFESERDDGMCDSCEGVTSGSATASVHEEGSDESDIGKFGGVHSDSGTSI